MATISVKDAGGNAVDIEKPLAPGRAAAAASRPVALSTEDAAALALLHTDLATTLAGFLDGLEALIGMTNSGNASILAKLSADPATQTTLAALLAKVIAAPATEAKQDTGNTSLASIANSLVSILAKILAAPATEAKQDALIAKVPTALGAGGGLKVDGSGTALPVSLPAIPTGSNVIGGITVADGSDATQGAKADAAYTGSGSASIVALLKGAYNALIAATPAGTNTIGQVNGNGASVEVVPAVTAGSYTAGFVIGGVMTFANVLPASFNGILESLTLKFKGTVQTTEFDVALFSAAPSGTFTEHAAPVIAAADSATLLGIFPMTAYQSNLGTHTVYTLDGIAKQIIGSSTSLYAVVTTKAVPVAPASTSEMSLRIGVAW